MTDLGPDAMDLVERFEQFYHDYYRDAIGDLAQHYPQEQQSLWIEARDLYRWDQDVLRDWRDHPDKLQSVAEEALANYDLPIDIDISDATVRLEDSNDTIDRLQVTDIDPNDHIGGYVAITGQMARVTGQSPRYKTVAFECQKCGCVTRFPQTRTEFREPHECQGCETQGPFEIDDRDSDIVKQRKIKLEEPISERSQARGQSIPVYVERDLVNYGPGDTILPDHAGEQVTILGVINTDHSQVTGRNPDPETEYWLDARAIVFEADDAQDVDIEAHRDEFEAIAAQDDAVDQVAQSLAPSLHAEEGDDLHTVRRAVAAWLFNGYRIDPDSGGSKRGDIHMCLIGDPGTGKSTLMSYVDDVLPKSEFRSGTGLTEVGLTSAAKQEEFAGKSEWTLEPGILPRADGGHCLIDEIDGVVDENTKAIHDALEGDQMVKADKAGITADLPTRTAVLVGGNPSHTRFDRHEAIVDQIDLDPALFDRMDLVFALQDEIDEESDRKTAKHSLDSWDELSQAELAERRQGTVPDDVQTIDPAVTPDVLRAWIAYARRDVCPRLTEDVKQTLQDFYVEVRNLNDGYEDDTESAVPATARTLEAGIRLSIALARLHLSETVEQRHAEMAIDLTKEVVGLTYDPNSGQFEDQAIRSGATKSQRDRIKNIKALIDDLEDGHDEGAPEETVIDRANMSDSKAEHEIENLKQKGEVYSPRTGYLRTS